MLSSFLDETTSTQSKKFYIPVEEKLPVSAPISIPKRSDCDLSSEYELNLIFFNPSKMSPPDCWKTRLEQRIKFFYDSSLPDKE
jgi:hypothetical protein